MKTTVEDHKFNDDLLLEAEDREAATRKYAGIAHVLNHPELRRLFVAYDKPANRAKRRARTAGLWAVGLVWIALAIASTEHFLAESPWAKSLGAIAAVCGLAGVIIGGTGILFAARKQEWLHRRLMTERIRQFHFQTFVFRLPEILRSLSGEEAAKAFVSQRAIWFEDFKARFDGKLEEQFVSVLEDERQTGMWLHEAEAERAEGGESHDLEPVFAAYRELRIAHQISYANNQLLNDRRIFSTKPHRQAAVFSAFGLVCAIFVCALHVAALVGVFAGSSFWMVNSGIASLLIIWIAIAALAARAVQDGLQPEREVERYQQYRSAVRFVLERFDRAASQHEKRQIMLEMERLVFDEMRNFLISANRSKFLM